ncbi:MAG: sugar ABC transporter permease [Candidatus Izemoplasmatales bacterium]
MEKRALARILKRGYRKEYKYFLLFAGIALLGFLLFYLVPVIRTIVLSFTDKTVYGIDVHFVGWDNYRLALAGDPLFKRSMIQSLVFAVGSGILVLVTSLILAMLLNAKVKGIGIFRTIYFLPFIIPAFAVGAVYKNILNPNTGLLNRILETFGVANPPLWYVSPETALVTMILVSAMGFGVKMLVFLAALQGIPASLYEVADIEGATPFRKFWKITMPLISPMLFLNVIMITIDGMRSFSLAYVMGNGSGEPAHSTLLFPIYMFMTAFTPDYSYELGYAAAMAWLFFLVILALTGLNFLFSRYYVQKDVAL